MIVVICSKSIAVLFAHGKWKFELKVPNFKFRTTGKSLWKDDVVYCYMSWRHFARIPTLRALNHVNHDHFSYKQSSSLFHPSNFQDQYKLWNDYLIVLHMLSDESVQTLTELLWSDFFCVSNRPGHLRGHLTSLTKVPYKLRVWGASKKI